MVACDFWESEDGVSLGPWYRTGIRLELRGSSYTGGAGEKAWKLQAEGGGWDPWPHEPCGVTFTPQGRDAKKSGPETWYRYKCLFYIKISQNGQLVVPRPLVKGWGWGGESLFKKATRIVVSHWA